MTTNAQAALAAAALNNFEAATVLQDAERFLGWLDLKDAQRPAKPLYANGGFIYPPRANVAPGAASLQSDPNAQRGYTGNTHGPVGTIDNGCYIPLTEAQAKRAVDWGKILFGEQTIAPRPAHKFPVPLVVTLTKEDAEILNGVRQHVKGKAPLKIKSTPRAPVLVEREGNLTIVTFLDAPTGTDGDAA